MNNQITISASHLIKDNLFSNRKSNKLNECCRRTIFFSFIYFRDFKIDDNNHVEIIIDSISYISFFKNILEKLKIEFNEMSNNKNIKIIFPSSILTNNLAYLSGLPKNECCRKTYLKISFFNCGYLMNPNKVYHLEFSSNIQEKLMNIKKILSFFEIKSRIYKKNNSIYSLYIKKIEYIIKFLAIIEANKTLLDIENLLIEKEQKNKITRTVNYETANIEKTIESSVKYIKAIEFYKEKGLFNNLSENLKEVANIRVKYPEESLQELVKYFDFHITKSGINHRLRKLYAIIQESMSL